MDLEVDVSNEMITIWHQETVVIVAEQLRLIGHAQRVWYIYLSILFLFMLIIWLVHKILELRSEEMDFMFLLLKKETIEI